MLKTITIVAFGDSITMDTHVENSENRWLSVLENMLSKKYSSTRFTVINSGVGGNSDREKMARYERDVLQHNPDILILQFGGNNSGYDASERFTPVREMEEYLQHIKDTIPEKTQIAVVTFPHVVFENHQFYINDAKKFSEFYKTYGGHEAALNQYREALKAFATKNGYPVIDLYKAMKGIDNVEKLQVGDGVHLNTAGDRLLGKLAFETLDGILQLKLDVDP